jgi:hypothetical protein
MKHHTAFSLAVCSLAFAIAASGDAVAAQKSSKDLSVTHATKGSAARGSVSVRPATPQPKPTLAGRPSKSSVADASASKRKSHRAMKTSKKTVPKAMVEPRTDLIHYGLLEDAQRYDPRPPADSTGVPHPQALDLTHDHFQELDRNQDGKIDPVERALGRIDMDRDLHSRTLQ